MDQPKSIPCNPRITEADLKALHGAAFGWARSCAGYDDAEAEEIMQAVYVRIMEGRAQFEGRSSFKTWLFSVIRNTAIQRQRKRQRRARIRSLLGQTEPITDPEALLDRVGQDEARRAILKALSGLPARQKEIIELVFYRDFTVEAAAEVMSVSVGTARTHYARAKTELQKRLKGKIDR